MTINDRKTIKYLENNENDYSKGENKNMPI